MNSQRNTIKSTEQTIEIKDSNLVNDNSEPAIMMTENVEHENGVNGSHEMEYDHKGNDDANINGQSNDAHSKKGRQTRHKKPPNDAHFVPDTDAGSHSVSDSSSGSSRSRSPSRSKKSKCKKNGNHRQRCRSASYSSYDYHTKHGHKSRRRNSRRSRRKRGRSRSYSSASRSRSRGRSYSLSNSPNYKAGGRGDNDSYNWSSRFNHSSYSRGHCGGVGGGGYANYRGGSSYHARVGGSSRWSQEERENPPKSRVLGCFGLSHRTGERELRRLFERYGNVEKVMLIIDRKTQLSKGYAFLYFQNAMYAAKAKDALTGAHLDGKQIRVDFSLTKRPHSPTPGTYFGRRYSGGGGNSGRRKFDNLRANDHGYGRFRASKRSR